MPIDNELIDRAKLYSAKRLAQAITTPCPDLFFLESFIEPELIDKLIKYVSTDSTLPWEIEPHQRYKNRLKIGWIFDTVIEEVSTVFDSLTPLLNKKFNRNNQLLGVNIWQDREGYFITRHDRDDVAIDLAMQIYLTESTINLGTTFEYNDLILKAQYKKNCGYLADNSVGIPHSMTTPIPAGHLRYSLYVSWGRIS